MSNLQALLPSFAYVGVCICVWSVFVFHMMCIFMSAMRCVSACESCRRSVQLGHLFTLVITKIVLLLISKLLQCVIHVLNKAFDVS